MYNTSNNGTRLTQGDPIHHTLVSLAVVLVEDCLSPSDAVLNSLTDRGIVSEGVELPGEGVHDQDDTCDRRAVNLSLGGDRETFGRSLKELYIEKEKKFERVQKFKRVQDTGSPTTPA